MRFNRFNRNKYMKQCIGILFFLLFVFLFFAPFFFQGKLPVPSDTLVGMYHPWRDLYAEEYPRGIPFKNFLITDPIRQQIPWRKIAIDSLKEGKLPLWNPYAFSGSPLLGNIQAGALYPLNALFFIFSFPIAWSLLIILQPTLAGVFLYIYLSSKKLHPFACLLGSIAWAFSGFSIAWLTWGTMVHTALWLPLMLFFIDRSKSRIFNGITLGVVMSCSFLAGHAQIFLYVFIFLCFYVIAKKRIRRFFLALPVFFSITSIQWKEFYSIVVQSSRVIEHDVMLKEGWFVPWKHLLQFLIPDFFGNPATMNYWGTWNYGELVGYIGIVSVVFSIGGILYSSFREKKLFLFILCLSFLFILPTSIAKLPYEYSIPLLSSLQPTRLLVLIVFILSIFSAYGFQRFLETNQENMRRFNVLWGMVFACVASIAFISWMLFRHGEEDMVEYMRIAFRNSILPTMLLFIGGGIFLLRKKIPLVLVGILLLLIVFFDLFRFGRKFTPFTDVSYFFPSTKIITYLQRQEKPFRVISLDDRILSSNVAAYYGIEMVSGYDPLYTKHYEDFIASIQRGNGLLERPYRFNRMIHPSYVDHPLFNLLNIKYVLSYGPMTDREDIKFIMNEGQTYLYERSSVLSRFFFVSRVISKSEYSSMFQTLFQINPHQEAVVLGNLDIQSYPLDSSEYVRIETYEDARAVIETRAIFHRFFVIGTQYTPQWKAYVDGTSVKIYQTNGAFMGIVIPDGEHRLELRYEL